MQTRKTMQIQNTLKSKYFITLIDGFYKDLIPYLRWGRLLWSTFSFNGFINLVGLVSRIRRLILHRGLRSPNEFPDYNTKRFNSKSSVLERWGMRSTPSLQLPPGPLWPSVILPARYGPNKNLIIFFTSNNLTVSELMNNVELQVLHCNTWNHLTMW